MSKARKNIFLHMEQNNHELNKLNGDSGSNSNNIRQFRGKDLT